MFDKILKLNKNIRCVEEINDSHDIISYSMILMNYLTSCCLKKYKTGIFKTVLCDKDYKLPNENLPTDIQIFLKSFNNKFSKYTNFEDSGPHELLKLDSYVQITSPIRRIVDLMNLICIQKSLKCNLSDNSTLFYNKWLSKLEYINLTMKSIRNVQNNTFLINKFTYHKNEINTLHKGFIFEKKEEINGIYTYLVYLSRFKIIQSFNINNKNIQNNKFYNFKIFVFNDENSLKKKIKLQLII